MEALRLQDGAYVSARYDQLQELRRQREQLQPDQAADEAAPCGAISRELSDEERQELEQWRIVERAAALEAQGPTPQWSKKFSVLASVLGSLYAELEADPPVTSPSKKALNRPETGDGTSPVYVKELPPATQVALKMFFRTCQSLRDPMKLTANSRLSVRIASKLPVILTTMPPCVLSPGLVDDTLEDEGDVSSVFYQLFRLFEQLLGVGDEVGEESSTASGSGEGVCLSGSDRATVIVAYVALALKWGRLAYLLKGVKLLLESGGELDGARFEPLGPLFREIATTSIERPQIAFGEEEQPRGYLMSFGKGDHGKLGHGQCSHVSCQEGNCTENKMVPTMIAATRDVLFRKIDSLSTHSIAITAKGEAMAWGNGDKYRLGHGSSSKEYMPRTIEFLSLKGRVRDLACGLGHTLALMESGELYAWGNGSNGRLGLGDTNDRSSPTRVVTPPLSSEESSESNSASTAPIRFRHVFCGASHSLGISWDGRAYAWGKNNQGQCGHGHTNDQWTIHEIESFRGSEEGEEDELIVYSAGGWEHTLFCSSSGRVYSCGCGYKDSRRAGIPPVLGHGDCDRRLKPTLVQTLEDAHEEVVKVACGWDHSLAVTANGRVYTWGSGTNGKLGHGDEESFDTPTLVRCMEGKKVRDAKAGCEHTVFLTYDHELWTCGQGDSGRLGHGDNQTRKRPTKIELFAECGLKPVALAVGDKYNLVLVKDADGHYDLDIENGGASGQNPTHPVDNGVVSSRGTTNTHHGLHRAVQQKKYHESQQILFGAKWVLEVAAGLDFEGGSVTTGGGISPKDVPAPSSASGVALFIAGHIDRLASDYIADIQNAKRNKSNAIETLAKPKSVLLPFAVDTSCESLSALLQLLRWTVSCSQVKEKAERSETSGLDESCVPAHVRMGLALSCLRILQLNLKKSQGVSSQNIGGVEKLVATRLNSSMSLFKHIHELLDTLAGLKGEDVVDRFDNGSRHSDETQNLSAVGSAVSQEAASALKMGFSIFYPTGIARSRLLWSIFDDCKITIPSMRTIILSDQLCKDSVMTEIFKCVPSYGLLKLGETFGEMHSENILGMDVFEIKTLMIMLLQRCSVEATNHLEDEAFTDFSMEPDCFLRLLHVLQTHYFSIVRQFAYRANNKRGLLDPDPAENSGPQRIMDSLLEYVDTLMTEALGVLKRLHKASRQHEDIITWRLNGSFFHTLLPSALECLSVLLVPDTKQENISENLLLVERILPNLHVMLKMLDEVSWKMHTACDGGNQTHDDSTSTPLHYLGNGSQERNWFVDLGDACAVLCGRMSCELLYPSPMLAMQNTQHGEFYTTILMEGSFLEERHDVVVSADMASSGSITRILEWERLGVFEVEDELVDSEDDPSTSGSPGAMPTIIFENQQFLLQLGETDFSDKHVSFWGRIAAKLSHDTQFTAEIQRLLTVAVSVSAWHLGLVDELRQAYELYDVSSKMAPQSAGIPTDKIWKLFTLALAAVKNAPWIHSRADSSAIANALKLSRLLLNLQPNPVMLGSTLLCEVEREDQHHLSATVDDSFEDLLRFLTSTDADVIECSFRARKVHAALTRTGICILHDLLRKLTTSSAESGLLNEFVAVTCASNHRMSPERITSAQRIALSRHCAKYVDKAVENLFVRLARIISSDDASFELRKKALLAWTVPLSTSKQSAPRVGALIAKSGIMSTLIELLLDDANVLETHSEINASTHFESHAGATTEGDKTSGSTPGAEILPTRGNPVNALLFDHTPAQVISLLAWEAFCAITWQLSKSEHFAQHRSKLFLRSAGLSLQDREVLTPRSTSMSPRRRLTLPKKMVMSTIDEIIEQLIDGLFLMLKKVKARFEAIDFFSEEFQKLLRPLADHHGSSESSIQHQKYDTQVFFGRLKQQHVAENHCVKVLQLLCQLVGKSERNSEQSLLAEVSFSDRWITLLTRMLLSTCRNQDLAQVYICYLLQDIAPRTPPLPEFDIQALGQSLLSTRTSPMKHASVEELFKAFNEKNCLPSTLATRQNEALYRLMQRRGMLHGRSNAMAPSKTKLSMRFAAAVHLLQTLCNTPSWKGRMDEYIARSINTIQCSEDLGSVLQSEDNGPFKFADVYAMVNMIAGYSEEELNLHRASTQNGITFPSPLQVCTLPFNSVMRLEDSGTGQVASIQTLVVAILKEGAQQTLSLPARSDILAQYHNDIVSVDAADRRMGSLFHLRARVLRVLMTLLLREQNESLATNTCHHFLLENAGACEDLLRVASSCAKEYVTAILGPDAKIAMKLRRLRIFSRDILRGGKRRRAMRSAVSIVDLESLQWRLREEMRISPTSTPLCPWWQQNNDVDGKLTIEVVGGDVELSELKVTALEHFPTVKLSQANICADSGLWFFEVTVLTDGLMQIGYVDGDFTADPLQGQGVGDHTNSWAFDGFRCKKWNVNSYDYGEQWKTDDVVGVLLDTDRMEISYFLNGKLLGIAFSGIPITASSRMCPAASLNVHQSAQFNFGTLAANEEGLQPPTLDGFKHLPTLDNEDQTRLRPIVYAIQSRRPLKSDGISNAGSQDKTASTVVDAGDDWSSSSDSDTDDGDIALEGSASLPGFISPLESDSRDGRETRTAGTNEDTGQRRRDLVEGLTGLGFPLEWATRCATETRLPMDETGAVAWILEQMEKVGLDGASTLPAMSAATDEGADYPGQPSVLWSTRPQLPDVVVNSSSDGLVAESGLFSGTGVSNSADKIDNQFPCISATHPGSSLTERQATPPTEVNSFIDADKDDQRSDDETTEAFQMGLYRQRQTLQAKLLLLGRNDVESTTNGTHTSDSKRGVDGLLPLSIAVDTTVFIAYTRQVFTSLLLLARHKKEQEAVYAMVRRLVSSEESSSKFHRLLRMTIGLDTMDAAFELGVVSDTIHSEQSLQLQKALAALLQYEAQNAGGDSDSTKNPPEPPPLFKSLSQEMLSHCDRGLSLVKNKKSAADPKAIQAAAVWFAWVAGLVLQFAETQALEISSSSDANNINSDFLAPVISSTAFMENLVLIASNTSSTSKSWKYVTFRLISRILSVCLTFERENSGVLTLLSDGQKASINPSSELFDSAQIANLTELFTLRRQREMHDRVFFSDITACLFTLLVRSIPPYNPVSSFDKHCVSETPSVNLVVNNYSSTHATISWEYVSPVANSDDIASDTNAETKAESSSSILFLQFKRCGPQPTGYSLQNDPHTSSTKALPSKGTYTIRNLLPDTTYRIRVASAQSTDGDDNALSVEDNMLQLATKGGAEVIVQTQPAPVFDLDKDTMGKNLELFNRNLSAKNTVNKKWHSVRASVAFYEGVHRWQVRLDTCVSKNIFIGVCTAEASMENYIGSDAFGYGFLANKAVWHNKAKLHSYGEIFKQGDVIEVTLDCTAKTLAFSRNGEYLGIAASNIRAGVSRSGVSGSDSTCKWYPAFSMYNKDDKVTLIPPPAVSAFRSKDSRPQNASTFELIDAMQSVLAYQSLVTSRKSDNDLVITKLFEKAYEAFQDWRHERKIFREKSLGEVIAIDRSSSATEKYGLAAGDSVFTSKGQCTVLGEYRHDLWFEVDEGGSSSLFGSTTTQLASWSLSACREMLASPDEYPVHRHHKYKLELESSTRDETQTVGSLLEQQDWATKTNEEGVSYQEFVEAQERWGDSGISAAELDAKLIAELDAIASQQASTSSLALSFADVSTALLLERIYEVHGISAERGSSQTMARMGLLLYVNRCLYSVARLAIPRNIYATSLGAPGSSDALLNEQEPGKPLPTTTGTECNQVSSVAALLNSPHWGLGDPSDFNFISTLAARILFASQKEKIICEELRTTTTTSRTSENLQESRDREEGGMDSDLPMITMNDLLPPPTPFWECSSRSKKPQSLRLPVSSDTSIFVQLATQLAAQDARQWRRESSQPFEAIPISQTFRVRVEKSTFNSSGEPNKETICQQQPNEEDEDQFQQPSSKQTAKYLQLFENVVREVQSPSFPLFAPVELPRKIERSRDGALEGELRSTLQLDINLELFSPTALAQSRVRIPQLLLWYFGFGQVLGIAWRSKILLPLQFISDAFWRELATPLGPVASNHEVQTDCGNRSATRTAAIRAIRDGLFSIIPSRCAALLSGNNRSLRERLSDVDVNYVARLERHATYTGPRQERHDMFWNVVNALTSLERRMLEQFIDPDRRNDMKQLEATLSGIDAPSVFVLEIADALADGRDHPDSCYPVVVQIGPQSSRLHLPAYSSAQTLRHKLLLAMTNIPFM